MTRDGFLSERFHEMTDKLSVFKSEFYKHPSTQRIDPFKIADDLYYVGDKMVCIHLLDTGDGLVLFDSGYIGTAHLLVDSIWRLGFDPREVKYIIHTHGHHDHFGSSEEFRIMYGTKLIISRIDAEALSEKPQLFMNRKNYPFGEIPRFDITVEDGEVFELGKYKIRFLLTPGHTDGVISSFFEVTDNGKAYLAGMFGGAGTNAVTLPYIHRNERVGDPAHDMLESIDKLLRVPVTLHLGNHPGNNDTIRKREKQLSEGGNPFTSESDWQGFLLNLRKRVETIIADNAKTEEEIKSLIGDRNV